MLSSENTVELLGYYGGDLTISQAAWTSTNRELNEAKIERVPQLLKFLANNHHDSPFERSFLHFLLRVDIATHIQIIRSRTIAVNAESSRYKELKEDDALIPSDMPEPWASSLREHTRDGLELYHDALDSLQHTVGRGRAKELARYFVTYNRQISMDVSLSFRAFHHFYNLRAKDNAQREIHDVADKMLFLIRNIEGKPFQHTLAAYGLGE